LFRSVLLEGMCLAIEPMTTLGRHTVVTLDDEWTVVTRDGKRAAHFEHSVAITADGPLVLTARESDRDKIAAMGFIQPNWRSPLTESGEDEVDVNTAQWMRDIHIE